MADFAVTTNFGTGGSRLTTGGDSITGWSNGGAEPDFFYQGSNSYSVLVKTSENNVDYTHASTIDMTTPKVVIFKIIQTNKDALDPAGDGFQIWIGNDVSNAYSYFVFTATTYPAEGGWQIVAIDPNVSQWRTATEGTAPTLSTIDFFNFIAECDATAKSQNMASDAIDVFVNGYGLIGTDGDGASADGTFDDFAVYDYDNTTNRYGVVQRRAGILYITGTLTIGSATATDFVDEGAVLVFRHHRVTTGFCGIDWDLQSASSVMSALNCVFRGEGDLYTSDDTRPDHLVSGTSGTLDLTGSAFDVYRLITFTTAVTAENCIFINGLNIIAGGASLVGSTVSDCTGAADDYALGWDVATDPDTYLDGMTFEKGTTATHAIEFGTSAPTTMTLRNMTFTGYNATDEQNDSTLNFLRTSGSTTVNIEGTGTAAASIGYKTTGTHTVTIVGSVTLTLQNTVSGSQCGIYAVDNDEELMNETSAGSDVTEAYTGSTPRNVYIRVRKASADPKYKPYNGSGQIVSGTGLTVSVDQIADEIIE